MPIAFFCACGKPIKAKDEFAGRKVKCAACGNVVIIPQFKLDKPAGAPTAKAMAATVKIQAVKEEPPPLAKPVLAPPLAKPVVRPPMAKPAAPNLPASLPNPWIDQSLTQKTTPWLPGDEEHFQKGIKAPREGSNWPIALLILMLLAGAVVASISMRGWGPTVR